MSSKSLLLAALLSGALIAQPRNFPQPPPYKEVTITAIPGVVAAGVKWTEVWHGDATADGIAGTKTAAWCSLRSRPTASTSWTRTENSPSSFPIRAGPVRIGKEDGELQG